MTFHTVHLLALLGDKIYEKVQDSVKQKPYAVRSSTWYCNHEITCGYTAIIFVKWHLSMIVIFKDGTTVHFVESLQSENTYTVTDISSTSLLIKLSDTGIVLVLSNDEISINSYN